MRSSIADVVHLDLESALGQMSILLDRGSAAAGRRQPAFLPIETVLCLATMRLVRHSKYGGSTSHMAEFPVPQLAHLFRRPPSSVLAKMANLDGSRPNGARWDRPAAEALLADGGIGLDRAYSIVLVAARRAGIDESTLPDFLAD